MVRIELTFALSGQSFIFNNNNVTNFQAIYNEVATGGNCSARLEYSGDIYNGKASIVGSEVLVTFDRQIIVPSGNCIDIECIEQEEEKDCKDVQINYSEDLRIAVLDDEGCLKGWIRLGDILKEVEHPDTLCKLYKVDEIPQGHLVASDRILTVDDNCMVKSISASDIVCEQ